MPHLDGALSLVVQLEFDEAQPLIGIHTYKRKLPTIKRPVLVVPSHPPTNVRFGVDNAHNFLTRQWISP